MAIEEKNQHSNEALHKCEIKLATSNSEANTAKEQVINIKADLEQKIIENQKTTDELRDEKSLSTGRLSEINILKAELAEVTANDCSEIIQELSNDLASAKTLITELSTEVKTLNKVIDKLNILKSD
ncbi:MAG: hypothetical protein HRU20_31875 [Pseudomonadales bacterium]|nr:hypothetical protein [Pseudomonadales bacterium]